MITALLIFFPLVAAVTMLFIKHEKAGLTAFYLALVELGIFGYAASNLKSDPSAFALDMAWLPFGAHFAVNMDGISFLLVMMTVGLMPLIITASTSGYYKGTYYALVFMMQSALIGVFTAMDGFLFYIFWELALIPIYFICLNWGGEGRGRITFKFFVYTLAGSLIMLAGLLYVYLSMENPSFQIDKLYEAGHNLSREAQGWVFWAMFIAFAVKMPIFPFHTWQPDTYTTAPTSGTMLLSSIMAKMGTYGLLRWLMPLVPQGWNSWATTAMILCVISIIYTSLIAIVQKDYKRLIAYSSIAHIGLIGAGIFAFNVEGLTGGVMQMLAHGVNVVGLFLICEILVERAKTRDITALGGIRSEAPQFALVFLIILLGSVALPLTNGFVGEFLLLNGVYNYKFDIFSGWFAVGAGLTVILGAVYMLRSYQGMMLGETKKITEGFADLDMNEKSVLYTVVGLVILLGVYPKPLLDIAKPAVYKLIEVFQAGLIG
jgi:NADH-quinone oxidoreductase subunit M